MTAHSSAVSPTETSHVVWRVSALILMALGSSLPASACAVCFGDPNSSQTHGMNWAIVTMLGFVAVVFAGLTTFTLMLRRRARAVSAPVESDTEAPANAVLEGGAVLG